MLSVLYLLKLAPALLFAIIVIAVISIDMVAFFSFKRLFKRTNLAFKYPIFGIYWLITLTMLLSLIWAFFMHEWHRNPYDFEKVYSISNVLFISINCKLIFIAFYFIQLILSNVLKIKYFSKKQIVLKTGLVLVLILVSALWYGTAKGRFNYVTHSYQIQVSSLPKAFEGLKIVQLSDLHLGTIPRNVKQFENVIRITNTEQPDFIFLTGDIINCFSEEYEPYRQSLSALKAKYGKFVIFGNHDYGDYYRWANRKEKSDNHKILIRDLQESGFTVLQNAHKCIGKEGDTLTIAGIENWGKPPYPQLGDIDEALEGLDKNKCVLLLSHDPDYWERFVAGKKNIPLTFSGHTHGMQIGISFNGFEWSPLWFMNKTPAGFYKKSNQVMYVSRGLGGALYPGRVGIWPEITVFTLHSGK